MVPRCLLGQTGISVSKIGLGTVKFGRNQGVKYPHSFQLPTDRAIADLLNFAKELGINLLDTAPAYGKSEARLGQYFKKLGNRCDWVIVGKFGENFTDGVSSFNFTKTAAIRSLDESLRRLGTDYLDILLVHSNGEDIEIIEKYNVFETLNDLKKTGKIRAYGMSTKTIEGGLQAIEKSDVAMVTYNPIETADQIVIARAHELGKGILIKKALGSGHINKISHENPVKKSIQFILKEPGVSSIIIGTLNHTHLEDIVKFANESTSS